jgi:hypothetical protein
MDIEQVAPFPGGVIAESRMAVGFVRRTTIRPFDFHSTVAPEAI